MNHRIISVKATGSLAIPSQVFYVGGKMILVVSAEVSKADYLFCFGLSLGTPSCLFFAGSLAGKSKLSLAKASR